jgi:hypothetical protein
MNCQAFRKHIAELLDHSPRADTAGLLKHASDCGECARELEASRSALASLAPSRRLVASPRLKERTMQQIQALEKEHQFTPAASSPRPRAYRRTWRYAIAAAAVLAVFAVLQFRGGGTPAFAEVIREFAARDSLRYVTRVEAGIIPMVFKVAVKHPGRMRMDTSLAADGPVQATSIMDGISGKGITLMHAQKLWIGMDLASTATATTQPGGDAVDVLQKLRNMTGDSGQFLGDKELDGRKLHTYRAEADGAEYLIYADPATKDIVRVEYELVNAKGMKGVMTDFDYMTELEDSFFSLEPPPGYKSAGTMKIDSAEPSEESLIQLLEQWANDTGEFPDSLTPPSAGQAMGKAFAQAFARARKGEKPPPKPREENMSELMEKSQAGTRGWMFVMRMKPENDLHYAGKGVKLGSAGTPIVWYKPTGAQNYRVIYGDLTVREVAPTALPKQ